MAAPTRFVSPNAEVVSKTQALMVNVAAARGLQNVLKTNLGENANWLCFCRVHFEIKPVLSYWHGLRTSSDLWIYFERRAWAFGDKSLSMESRNPPSFPHAGCKESCRALTS